MQQDESSHIHQNSTKKEKSKVEMKILIGPPKLTRYERARIIGARALQISMGAPVLIDIPENVEDPLTIAEMELEMGILPITIRRRSPDGKWQDIPLKWLLELKKEEYGD
ncbi:MAG: DNA-directed RNA polymerase subunit K [Candidatus Methanomethylicota archaeon]|uniref:DNA-directed RNA polymerase subunit Rpo6 n=1 Tax=Thermoproteota archaeon TaxID=2056631 RepID=A0A497F219_9CREN|nr:MAG: DNA-directed RNA polymerase subunit K [Candidatus Verstraetearchaeota archaeon]